MNSFYGGFGRPAGMRGELALMQYFYSRTALRGYAKPCNAQGNSPLNPIEITPEKAPDPPQNTPEKTPQKPPENTPENPNYSHISPPESANFTPKTPEKAIENRQNYIENRQNYVEIPQNCAEIPPPPARKSRRFTPKIRGLLTYKRYWLGRESDFRVNGETITGTPLYLRGGTLRVVNPSHSYYIPLEKIDYVRTDDGYNSPFCRKSD